MTIYPSHSPHSLHPSPNCPLSQVTDGTQALTPSLPLTTLLRGGAMTYFSFGALPPTAVGLDNSWSVDVVVTGGGGGGGGGPPPAPGALALTIMATNAVMPNGAATPAKPMCNGGPFGGVCDGVQFMDFQWTSAASSAGALGVQLDVPSSSPGFTNGSTYMLGVYAIQPVVVALTASYWNLAQMLQDGVSVPLTIQPAAYRFFVYELAGPGDVEFDVTTTFGDANLYVSFTAANTRPTAAWNDVASTAFGTAPDSVIVHWAAIQAAGATTCVPAGTGGQVCPIYIGVGASNVVGGPSSATLIGAYVNSSIVDPVLLEDGVPSIGHAELGFPKVREPSDDYEAASFPYD